jgi:hypothetical protein
VKGRQLKPSHPYSLASLRSQQPTGQNLLDIARQVLLVSEVVDRPD